MKQDSIQILGTRVDSITFKQAIEKAISILKGKTQHYFVTPNPEIILEAEKNKKFQKVLNQSTLNTPDGAGLLFAARFLKLSEKSNTTLPERVTGTDLTIKLIQLSKAKGFSIFFLGASEESNEKTVKFAKKHKARVAGNYTGKPNDPKCLELIKKTKPDLVFVAFGAPAQELWIAKNLSKCKSVKLMIGIGGAFDFIAGTRKRAPTLFQKLGIEWLYRLIQEPRRIKRIFNAVIVFPIKVFINSLKD